MAVHSKLPGKHTVVSVKDFLTQARFVVSNIGNESSEFIIDIETFYVKKLLDQKKFLNARENIRGKYAKLKQLVELALNSQGSNVKEENI